ncbi:MAG: hypothetical protein ACPGO5_00040 [Patescibacteria group bacterium]
MKKQKAIFVVCIDQFGYVVGSPIKGLAMPNEKTDPMAWDWSPELWKAIKQAFNLSPKADIGTINGDYRPFLTLEQAEAYSDEQDEKTRRRLSR